MRYGKNWHGFDVLLRKSTTALILPFVLCALTCCNTPRRVKATSVSPPVPDPIVRDRLVQVSLPPDSAVLTALFERDSISGVRLKAYSERKSTRAESTLSFKEGRLDYAVKVKADTVFLPAKDSIIYIPQPVEVEVNRLTWWQETWLRVGKISLSLLALWLGLKGIQKLLKRNKT